mgnify:CR=1 FL=1
MTRDDWRRQIADWQGQFDLRTRPPIPVASRMEGVLSELADDFVSLYAISNGLRSEGFQLLPMYSPEDPKGTWDSLERANEIASTRFLHADPVLLERFFIFAEIGGGCCACILREDGGIWFEDDEGIHQTDLDLRGFVETMLWEDGD